VTGGIPPHALGYQIRTGRWETVPPSAALRGQELVDSRDRGILAQSSSFSWTTGEAHDEGE
jgi:hypothetical protein